MTEEERKKFLEEFADEDDLEESEIRTDVISKEVTDEILSEIINVSKETIVEAKKERDKKALFETAKNFFCSAKEECDEFDIRCKTRKEGFKMSKFKDLEEKMEGIEPGVYVIGAESNVGKSAFLMNIFYDLCSTESNKLYGLYIAIDDQKDDIYARVIAMNKRIPIGCVSKPLRYEAKKNENSADIDEIDDWLEEREIGIKELSENMHFRVMDGNDTYDDNDELKYPGMKTVEDIEDFIIGYRDFVKSLDPENEVAIAIDALDDLRFKNERGMDENTRMSEISKSIKRWKNQYKIPIFVNKHLRKLNQTKRPVLDAVKSTIEIIYDANIVWLLHNDVSKSGQAATVFYTDYDSIEKMPVMEVNWSKNKKSSYKGTMFFTFTPNFSRIEEVDEETARRYMDIISGTSID